MNYQNYNQQTSAKQQVELLSQRSYQNTERTIDKVQKLRSSITPNIHNLSNQMANIIIDPLSHSPMNTSSKYNNSNSNITNSREKTPQSMKIQREDNYNHENYNKIQYNNDHQLSQEYNILNQQREQQQQQIQLQQQYQQHQQNKLSTQQLQQSNLNQNATYNLQLNNQQPNYYYQHKQQNYSINDINSQGNISQLHPSSLQQYTQQNQLYNQTEPDYSIQQQNYQLSSRPPFQDTSPLNLNNLPTTQSFEQNYLKQQQQQQQQYLQPQQQQMQIQQQQHQYIQPQQLQQQQLLQQQNQRGSVSYLINQNIIPQNIQSTQLLPQKIIMKDIQQQQNNQQQIKPLFQIPNQFNINNQVIQQQQQQQPYNVRQSQQYINQPYQQFVNYNQSNKSQQPQLQQNQNVRYLRSTSVNNGYQQLYNNQQQQKDTNINNYSNQLSQSINKQNNVSPIQTPPQSVNDRKQSIKPIPINYILSQQQNKQNNQLSSRSISIDVNSLVQQQQKQQLQQQNGPRINIQLTNNNQLNNRSLQIQFNQNIKTENNINNNNNRLITKNDDNNNNVNCQTPKQIQIKQEVQEQDNQSNQKKLIQTEIKNNNNRMNGYPNINIMRVPTEVTPEKKRNDRNDQIKSFINKNIGQSSLSKKSELEIDLRSSSEQKLTQLKHFSKSPSRFFAHVKEQLSKVKNGKNSFKDSISSFMDSSFKNIEQDQLFKDKNINPQKRESNNYQRLIYDDNSENLKQNDKIVSKNIQNSQNYQPPIHRKESSTIQLERSRQQIQNIKDRITEISKYNLQSDGKQNNNNLQSDGKQNNNNQNIIQPDDVNYEQDQQRKQNKANQIQFLINTAEYSLELDTDYSPIVDGKKVNINIFKNTSRIQDSTESLQAQLK